MFGFKLSEKSQVLITKPVKSLAKVWTKVKATKTAFTFPKPKRAPVSPGGQSVVPIIAPPTGAPGAPATQVLRGVTDAHTDIGASDFGKGLHELVAIRAASEGRKLAYTYVNGHGVIVPVYVVDSSKVIAVRKMVRKRAEAEDVAAMSISVSVETEVPPSRDPAPMEAEVPSLRNACRFINTRDFILRAKLDFGAFAIVYRAEDKITGEVMALKVVNKCNAGPRQLYLVRMEAYAMKRVMGDPYCTEIKAAFQDEHKLYMALSFCPGGSLWSVIDNCPSFRLPVHHARVYAAELLVGVHHIHRYGIIHRDIKPENILVDSHGHLVIADFGFAKVFPHAKPGSFSPYNPTGTSTSLSQAPYRTKGICGSPLYMAPEVVLGDWYGFAVDFWAVGVMLYEMLAGMHPFVMDNGHSHQDAITRFDPFFSDDFDPEAKHLLQMMLKKEVGSRPLYRAMLDHPFFASIDWDRVEERSFPPVHIPLTEERDADHLSTPPPPFTQCSEPKGPLPHFDFVSPTLKCQRRHVQWRIRVQRSKQVLAKLAVKAFPRRRTPEMEQPPTSGE